MGQCRNLLLWGRWDVLCGWIAELLAITGGRGEVPFGKVGVMLSHPSPFAWLLLWVSTGALY